MPPSRKVTVFGTSLLLSMIADQLQERTDLIVARISPQLLDAIERIQTDRPDVLIIENAGAPNERSDRLILQLLEACPTLIMLHSETPVGQATILHSQQIEIENLANLAQVIDQLTAQPSL
jgi:hypothetical protein